jgi:hypothetical protein
MRHWRVSPDITGAALFEAVRDGAASICSMTGSSRVAAGANISAQRSPTRLSQAEGVPMSQTLANDVVICSAARTPIGKFLGVFSGTPATELGARARSTRC